MTIWLTVAAMMIGIVLGTAVALMRISDNRVLGTAGIGLSLALSRNTAAGAIDLLVQFVSSLP